MLDVTASAAALIDALIQAANLGPGSGLRLDVDPMWDSLAMCLVGTASAEDSVLVRDEARVFIAPSAAGRLDARTLDARGESPMFLLINS